VTEAVLHYREMAATGKNETRIPELCLSLSIASDLIAKCGLDARREASYPSTLQELGYDGRDITPDFGLHRADIAIYTDHKPTGVVEIKIINEGRVSKGVIKDRNRIALFRQRLSTHGLSNITGFVGALVRDNNNGQLAETTADALCDRLQVNRSAVEFGARHESSSGGWGWIFVCAHSA
jgi:hypothetical protein